MASPTLHIPAEKNKTVSSLLNSTSMNSTFSGIIQEEEGKLALDIFETEDELVFLAPMAGVDIEQIEVVVTEDVLTISGERNFPKEIFPEEPSAFLEECYWGRFSRSIVLPAAVNSESISAKLKNGILIIIVPKAKKAKSKRVPIEML